MTAKQRRASAENHERWLVSYADFITLLFAFFVVLFASTQGDKGRAKAVSAAVDRALRNGALAPKVVAILGGESENKGRGNATRQIAPVSTKKPDEEPGETKVAPDLNASMQVLAGELQQEIADQKVKLNLEQRGLIVGLEEAAFFDSGDDAVKPTSYPIVEKVARVLGKLPNPLRLEGHTDSVPINNLRFHDNWELSAARSIAMLRVLDERFGIDAARMAVVGYADTARSEPDTTPEARARNRRVDIVVVSGYGMRAESPDLSVSASGPKKY
jgi:chemotaxis protein MotB